jgi:hypothetical protein
LRTSTVSPGAGLPRTSAMAPEKIQGCRRAAARSRFGWRTTALMEDARLAARLRQRLDGLLNLLA